MYLPTSRRGANRDLLVPMKDFALEMLVNSEAYAYQFGKAHQNKYGAKDFEPTGPMTWLGCTITVNDLLYSGWRDCWPKPHRPSNEDKVRTHMCALAIRAKLLTVDEAIFVVDRYGGMHLLKSGEQVEPMDWKPVPITVTVKETNDHDYY